MKLQIFLKKICIYKIFVVLLQSKISFACAKLVIFKQSSK